MTELTFQHAELANGLTLIGEHNPAAQSVAAGYFVNAGSRDETVAISGVSHFLEHMMFKGSDRRSAEDINREFDELGARYNAYTSEERTVYYGAVLPEKRERLLALLSDMMRPALRQADFDLEKQVILEEIAMYEDRPHVRVFDEGNLRYFHGHPVGNSVLGTVETIRALEREQMLAYFRARYAPNNLVLVLAGAYDWEEVVEQATELTADWQAQDTGRAYPELQPRVGDERLHDAKLGRSYLAAYAPGVSAQDERRYAAAILASLLGDSSGSRLYWALVDKGLADSASLSHDSGDRVGTFVGYASTAPERAGDVLERFRTTLQAAQDDLPDADEWSRAQRKIATSLTLRGETPFGRLMSLGAGYLYTRAYHRLEEVAERILSTPLEEAHALLAERPFDRLFTLRLGPGLQPGSQAPHDAAG